MFVPAPFFMLRSPLWAIEDVEQLLAQENWIDAVFHLYETEELFRQAVAIASASLHQALQKKSLKNREDLAASLLKYAMRMATRATPFGLFSFVALGSWGEKTDISLNLSRVHQRARPDMEWIYALVQKLYGDEKLFPSLPVRVNPLAQLHGERILLSYTFFVGKKEKNSSKTISIRASKLVTAILTLSQEPKEISALCDELLAALPMLDRQKTLGVIRELLSQQLLLPALLPSLLSTSPFDDLLAHIPAKISFSQIAKGIQTYNQTPLGKGETALEQLQKEMQAIAPAQTLLQVDAAYENPSFQLPLSMAEQLGKAASLLWKISPPRSPLISAYHAKFVEKYGIQRTVPLLDLLSEEKGLGPLQENPSLQPLEQTSKFAKQWEKWLHTQWQESLRTKKREIRLSEKEIDHLFTLVEESPPEPQKALSSFDLFCKIIASSQEEIDRKEALFLLSDISWQGGATLGRFLDLYGKEGQNTLQQFFRTEEQLEEDSLFVELSYWPAATRSANVAIHPCLRKVRLDLQESSQESDLLSLDDIYVGATGSRLYLTLKEGKKEIIARAGNLLNPSYGPAPLQFMREVSLAKYHLPFSFSWGALSATASFLPRVQFEQTILSAAQWNLDAFPLTREPLKKITQIFTHWADTWNLPRYSLLASSDQQLLIDRNHPAHLHELSHKLKKGESLHFIESLTQGWTSSERGKHLPEIVIPFSKNPAHAEKTRAIAPPAYSVYSTENRWKLPASEWLFAKFYLGEEGENRFLIQHLLPLAERLRQELGIAGWFFVRYSDPQRHLRFRIRIEQPQSLAAILTVLSEASSRWMEAGLIKEMILAGYEREIERYGGLLLIEYAEALFCADTIASLHLLQASSSKRLTLAEPLVHTLSTLHFLRGFGLEQKDILALLTDPEGNQSELKGFREHRNQLIALSQTDHQELLPFQESSELRRGAQELFRTQAKDLPHNTLWGIYNNMLHMHCNRLGCSKSAEEKARLYARHTLMQLERRSIRVAQLQT